MGRDRDVQPPEPANTPVTSSPEAKCCLTAPLYDVEPRMGQACSPTGQSVFGFVTLLLLARAFCEPERTQTPLLRM